MTAKDEVVPYIAVAIIAVSIIVVCFRDTGVLLATKKSFKCSRKASLNKSDLRIDADLRNLQDVNIMLDVIERDILPLTCTAVCRAANSNKA